MKIQFKKERKYVSDFIKYIEKSCGKEICTHENKKDYAPSCFNCQAQWTLGWLREHLSNIDWIIDNPQNSEK